MQYNFFYASIGSIRLLIALSVISFCIIPISLLVPKIESMQEQAILTEDVIQYELKDSAAFWLRSLDINLIAYRQCTLEVLSVGCEDIVQSTLDYYETELTTDHIYLTEGTTLSFTFTSDDQLHISLSPKYIWIFDDSSEANRNMVDDFESLACSKPPRGILCLKVNDSYVNTRSLVLPGYHITSFDVRMINIVVSCQISPLKIIMYLILKKPR